MTIEKAHTHLDGKHIVARNLLLCKYRHFDSGFWHGFNGNFGPIYSTSIQFFYRYISDVEKNLCENYTGSMQIRWQTGRRPTTIFLEQSK